ncbi:hypothetical protein [Olleya sp. YS]|uniref:hypothetical protein n=1 Tax=Olleya sp. YS TaxID=3028318 RepID=UPI0024345B18|nr:hypothetical protein [Olleya sp. YS]WGD34130.1 hypothetical protein Ollyesu_10120 [Olleya sp. YS]
MQNPNILKGSDIQITNMRDAYKISIPGYRLHWNVATLFRLLLIGFCLFVPSFLLYRATETKSIIIISVFLVIIILLIIIFHSDTIITYSKNQIKVGYNWCPLSRIRKTEYLERIYTKDEVSSSNDGPGSSFSYLVLKFSKQRNISIMIDPLTRQETEFLTGRLSYIRYKFLNENKT